MILAQNDYPDHVIDREINRFVENRSHPQSNTNQVTTETIDPSNSSKTRFIVLPYVSHRAEGFAKRLKGVVNKYYPDIDFNVAFKTPDEIGKHFSYKDKITKATSRSLVVYKINCGYGSDSRNESDKSNEPEQRTKCDASYIGKTERILQRRINEHMSDPSSACYKHQIENPDHRMQFDKVEILDSADSNFKLECKELLHIIQRKPSLNKQLNAQSKFDIKTLIIAAYKHHTNEASTP